jgi:hypothetical protein
MQQDLSAKLEQRLGRVHARQRLGIVYGVLGNHDTIRIVPGLARLSLLGLLTIRQGS